MHCDGGIGCWHREGIARDGVAVQRIFHHISLGHIAASECDGGACRIVGHAVDINALARGGDTVGKGEGMDAARAILVFTAAAYSHADIDRGSTVYIVIHCTIVIVVGGEGAGTGFDTCDGTGVVIASDIGTECKTVADGAVGECTYNAADVGGIGYAVRNGAFEGASADGDASSVGAVADASNAANGATFFSGSYPYVALHPAVLDGSTVVAHDAAGIVVTGNTGIGENDVLNDSSARDVAKESLARVVVGGVILVDAYSADCVVLAVVGTPERMTPAADGGEVVLMVVTSVPCRGVAVGDVGGLLEGDARAVVVATDIEGEVIEVGGRGNLVGVVA